MCNKRTLLKWFALKHTTEIILILAQFSHFWSLCIQWDSGNVHRTVCLSGWGVQSELGFSLVLELFIGIAVGEKHFIYILFQWDIVVGWIVVWNVAWWSLILKCWCFFPHCPTYFHSYLVGFQIGSGWAWVDSEPIGRRGKFWIFLQSQKWKATISCFWRILMARLLWIMGRSSDCFTGLRCELHFVAETLHSPWSVIHIAVHERLSKKKKAFSI